MPLYMYLFTASRARFCYRACSTALFTASLIGGPGSVYACDMMIWWYGDGGQDGIWSVCSPRPVLEGRVLLPRPSLEGRDLLLAYVYDNIWSVMHNLWSESMHFDILDKICIFCTSDFDNDSVCLTPALLILIRLCLLCLCISGSDHESVRYISMHVWLRLRICSI